MTESVSIPKTAQVDPHKNTGGLEIFLRCFVLLFGIFLGLIVAFVIAVVMGWFPIQLC